MRQPSGGLRRNWLLLGLIFLGPYALATMAPGGATWGIHALGYFPLWARIGGLIWCGGLLWPPIQEASVRLLDSALRPLLQASRRGRLLLVALGTLAFAVFYLFPMRTDIYGDSRTILFWNADNTTLPLGSFARIFDLHLLANREILTILLHRVVAHLFAISIGESYRIVGALSGALCLVLWVLFIRRDFADSRWGPLLVAVGCLLGSNQIFFGHIETYPFATLPSLAFLVVGSLAFERKAFFWATPFLLWIAVKAHPATLYFIPAFLVLALHALKQRVPSIARLLTWKSLSFLIVLPSLVAGAWLYFFYFKSYNAPYAGIGREVEHSFLPIIPSAPPLDRYSLQSPSHILDLANVLLLVGTPILVGLLGILLMHRKAIDWMHPRVVFATLGFVYPLLFFVALNPDLSMPRDWDLYALLAPPLLLFFATVLAHSDERVPSAQVHGTTLAFGVFSIACFVLNVSPARLSTRLENVGEYVFGTYHAGASYIINVAQSMEPDTTRALARRIATVRRLGPSRVGEDGEYAHLMAVVANIYCERGDLSNGVSWMERASSVTPHDDNLSMWLADYYLRAQRTDAARRLIGALLRENPRNLNALVQGAIAAGQERDLAGALAYLERARDVAPGDPRIDSWIARVKSEMARTRPKSGVAADSKRL